MACVLQYFRQNYLSSLLDSHQDFLQAIGMSVEPIFPAQDLEESEQMLHQAQAGGVPALSHRTLEIAIEVRQRDGGRVLGESLGLNNEKIIWHTALQTDTNFIYYIVALPVRHATGRGSETGQRARGCAERG